LKEFKPYKLKFSHYLEKLYQSDKPLIIYKVDKGYDIYTDFSKKTTLTNNNINNFFNLKLVLNKIYSLGCRNLLVEGGKALTNSFLKLNIFNQFYLFQSSNKFGKTAKLNVYSELNQLSYKYKKKSKLNSFTGDDIIYLYSK